MTGGQLLLNGLAAFLTLCIFSFLYRDNPFYKFAERLVAGVATGYWTMLLFHTNFVPVVWNRLAHDGRYEYIIPTMLGLMMWTRFSKKWSWVSRYSIAFYIGISSGITITLSLYASLFRQLEATINQPLTFDAAGISSFLIIVGVLSALVYFFFSAAHKGSMGVISRIGIYVIMIGFGAGFGMTVMGRIALLVQRVIFLRGYVNSLTAFFGG
ncbi:MAG: hypothetical protein A2W25_09760 [candidate division Zixibacteria bacterium RBG_16_53_22]|nr:MAG: hypothetical protein A2W25_09760 [candidate division Zixibacteria bacterium RBG_16_53_22]